MTVQIVDHTNSYMFSNELEQNFRLRHKVFAEQRNWKELKRPDKRDVDQFDTNEATHLLAMHQGNVAGGARFNSLAKPALLTEVFGALLQKQLPDDPERGLDWTRFYVYPGVRSANVRRAVSGEMFCSAMEYALLQHASYMTFVSTTYMVELGRANGWHIEPLGDIHLIEGKKTVAAWIRVDVDALLSVRERTGISHSVLHRSSQIGNTPTPLNCTVVRPQPPLHQYAESV